MWEEFSSKVGFWADMENPYITYENDYIESEWWALKQIFDKGLLYKGFKIVPYCPRCGTPLSSHEVAQGYKTVKEKSAIVAFKLKDEDTSFLVWTTTPWTLPSNVALCVNPNEEYIKVLASNNKKYIIAKPLADKVLSVLAKNEDESADKKEYEILETYKGTDLKGIEYEPLFEETAKKATELSKKAFYVVCDDYVTMSDGTGIVHTAPAFGEDDARLGRENDLPFIQFVDGAGKLTEETRYAGIFVKDADKDILSDLKAEDKLFSAPKFEHEYPFCWRCDTPLIYYARESWFIKMTSVKENLIKNNNQINWIPETIGSGRFGAWLSNIQDWGISRDRYWGTPLNIWVCNDCGKLHSIGSREELRKKAINCPEEIELHKPYIDEIKINCECGGSANRVEEVIDCWFDSGSMPFAQHHYPFENEDLFKEQFPARFISEAVDQTRGWFYSLLAVSTLLFDKPPYENVIVLGHVLDKDGAKMSKSKGNAIDPMDALNTHGADAIRWYFYENSMPHLPNRFYDEAVIEGQRKFISTLWNTYSFYILYANIDNFNPNEHEFKVETLSIMDRWLLSRLNSVVKNVDNFLLDYKITEAARTLEKFVDDLSNWYVRRSRERFWGEGMEQDKINAYMTLYTAIVTICKVAAPMIPFMTESIYQNMVRSIDKNAPISIHLCDFPTFDEKAIDEELEEDMEKLLEVVVLGRAARNITNIKTRQPIGKMLVSANFSLKKYFTEIIEDELNVKEVDWTTDVSEYTTYSLKPQLKTLGPKYGKLIGKIKAYLEESDGNAVIKEIEKVGKYEFEIDGTKIELSKDDLLIGMKEKDGFVASSDNGITVVFDTTLTKELIDEGYFRELVSKIQSMRKDAGYEVMDKINVHFITDNLKDTILSFEEALKKIVLASKVSFEENKNEMAFTKEWDINGQNVVISINKE